MLKLFQASLLNISGASNRPCSIHHFFRRGTACSRAGETYGYFCLQSCQDHSQGFDQRKSKIEHLWIWIHQVMRAYLNERNSSAARCGKFSLCLFWVLCSAYECLLIFILLRSGFHPAMTSSFSILFFIFFRLAVKAVCTICMWGSGTTGWRRQERSRTTRPTSCWWRAPVERVVCVLFFWKIWRKDLLYHPLEHCIPDFAVLLQIWRY